MCFASDDATKYVQGKSWVAETVRTFDIEIKTVELPTEIKKI